jgi:hypothetical protein
MRRSCYVVGACLAIAVMALACGGEDDDDSADPSGGAAGSTAASSGSGASGGSPDRSRATFPHIQNLPGCKCNSAFHGQRPDEIYFGRGDHVPERLARAWRRARQARLQTNRQLSYEECRAGPAPPNPSEELPRGQGEPQ